MTQSATTRANQVFRLSATAVACLGAPALAHAGVFTPPSGVPDYRLAFVTTDPTTATSSSIATYNSFVTTEAAANAALPSTTWAALISTPTTSAASNVDCGTACDALPIYLVDGTLVASSLANLFAGTIINSIAEDQNGAAQFGYVWTGSNSNGTASTGNEAGSTGGTTELGDAGFTGTGMIDEAFADSSNGVSGFTSNGYSVFAISGAISNAPPVPEPASAALLGLGATALAALRRRKRR